MTVIEFLTQRIRPTLRDEVDGGDFWFDAELLGYLNEGLAELVKFVPESTSVTAQVSLVSGARQTLPASAYQLLEVISNTDGGGNYTGNAVRRADRVTMDTDYPTWMSATAATNVKRYVADAANPRQFFVYPPNNGSGNLELTYATVPSLATTGTTIPVDNVYLPALANYVLFKSYNKLSEDVSFAQKAASHAKLFYELVGSMDSLFAREAVPGRVATAPSAPMVIKG